MRARSSSPTPAAARRGRSERRLDDQRPAGAADGQQHRARVRPPCRPHGTSPLRSAQRGPHGPASPRSAPVWGGPRPRARGWSSARQRTARHPAARRAALTTADSWPEMNVSGASASSMAIGSRPMARGARPERPRRFGMLEAGTYTMALLGAQGGRRQRQSVEHEMGRPREQQCVLAAGGFAFGTVGHHDRAPARGPGDRPPLGRHREPRPTVAHQPACLELVDQPVRLVMELAPSVEMGPQPRVLAHLRPRARAAGGWSPSGALRASWRRVRLIAPNFPRAGR